MRRSTTQPQARVIGPRCPQSTDEADHGPLIGWTGAPGKSFYCPNVAHAGRPKTHPDGAAPATSPFFSIDEVAA